MSLSSDRAVSSLSATVALCGNPNCGKTTLFNALTGLSQKVGNYPGVTVDKVSGRFRLPSNLDTDATLVDVPGTYSLAAFSPDEYIAARALFGRISGEKRPDTIVCVIDATNLERGFYLLFQILQIGCPVVVALNMIDLAERRLLKIDAKELSRRLQGIPVVPVIGSKGKGIPELRAAIGTALGTEPRRFDDLYHELPNQAVESLSGNSDSIVRSRAEWFRVIFDESGPAEKSFLTETDQSGNEMLTKERARIRERFGNLSSGEVMPLSEKATALYSQAVDAGASTERQSLSDRVDKVLLHPVIGPIILLALMTLIFQSIFSWSEPLMNVIDSLFGWLAGLVERSMADGPLRSLLADGIIGGVGSVLLFLPQIIILFLFMSLLEDSGYMPRAAFLVDRIFGWCGLSGKSFIPMLSSFACAVPGIMATRTIEDRKLRLITIIVSPLMSCSARLPVYTMMIAAFVPMREYFGLINSQGLVLTSLYLLGIAVAVVVSFVLNRLVLKGERGSFMMEMPSYKVPTARSVLIRVVNRARAFVVRAGTVILAITIIIWVLSYFPRSELLQQGFQAERDGVENRFEQAQVGTSPTAVEDANLTRQAALERIGREEAGAHLRNSYLAWIGRAIEPVFAPIGWDWRITMATLASFPAREVIVATIGTIFNLGSAVSEEDTSLIGILRQAKWEDGPKVGQPLFTIPVALSIMVFFALCCQCGATLVTIRQESNSWLVPTGVFTYMTLLAYGAAALVYKLAVSF